jgi:aspartate racemase
MMHLPTPTIGVLAGMGPRSTAPFVDQLITACQQQYGAADDESFPPIMIYSLPTPFFVDREIDHPLMFRTIQTGLRRLEATGADLIVMPCNSAHLYYADLAASIKPPLLNMMDEALRCVPESTSRIALIGTRHTTDAGLYQRAIENMGRRVILDGHLQSRVDALILSIKHAPGIDALHEAQTLWDQLQLDVMARGADTIMIACTDLDAIRLETAATVINATQCLAAAAIRDWLRLRQPA